MPAEQLGSSGHPALHNMSLHDALQLRELLRARVRTLHRAHTDALEGLRRRQWELEQQNREQEARTSAYPPQWTRLQYEEMQPLDDERQYEPEQQEDDTASQDDGSHRTMYGIPLTVPALDSYWYERKDGGFCAQLAMYKRCLADLDRVYFS